MLALSAGWHSHRLGSRSLLLICLNLAAQVLQVHSSVTHQPVVAARVRVHHCLDVCILHNALECLELINEKDTWGCAMVQGSVFSVYRVKTRAE